MEKFSITHLEPSEPRYDHPEWKDLIRVPWGVVVSLVYFLPKAIWMLIKGQDVDHHHDSHDISATGWHPLYEHPHIKVEKKYFYAEDAFGDFFWHTVDGFQLRATPSLEGLDRFYFVRDSFFEFDNGMLGQAINVEGNRHDCPLLYLDFARGEVSRIHSLRKPYLFSFEEEQPGTLRVKGKASDDRFEFILRLNSTPA